MKTYKSKTSRMFQTNKSDSDCTNRKRKCTENKVRCGVMNEKNKQQTRIGQKGKILVCPIQVIKKGVSSISMIKCMKQNIFEVTNYIIMIEEKNVLKEEIKKTQSNDLASTSTSSDEKTTSTIVAPEPQLMVKNVGSEEWYPAKIVEIDWMDSEILVTLESSVQRDEWIAMDSSRLKIV